MKVFMNMIVIEYHMKLVQEFHIKVVSYLYFVQQVIQQNVQLIMIQFVDMNMQDEN